MTRTSICLWTGGTPTVTLFTGRLRVCGSRANAGWTSPVRSSIRSMKSIRTVLSITACRTCSAREIYIYGRRLARVCRRYLHRGRRGRARTSFCVRICGCSSLTTGTCERLSPSMPTPTIRISAHTRLGIATCSRMRSFPFISPVTSVRRGEFTRSCEDYIRCLSLMFRWCSMPETVLSKS